MKRSAFFKLLSMLLVFALLVELLPVSAFAAPDEEEMISAIQEEPLPEIDNSESTDEQDIETPENEEVQKNACVVGEVTELREEGVKHFRMDDGSFIAVDYGMPVHFTTDGGDSWEAIDNTLMLTDAESYVDGRNENGDTVAASQKYSSSNGNKRTSFARDLQSGFLFASESNGHEIRMSLPTSAANKSEASESGLAEDTVDMELKTEELETFEPSVSDEQEPSANSVAPVEVASEEAEDRDGLEVPMVAEGSYDETTVDTANVESSAETNTTEAFNAAASAEVSYPQDQQKQPDQGNSEGQDSNDRASRSLEEQVMPSRLTADVLYRDVYNGVDLSYKLCGYDVKENIIVNSRRDSYAFTFCLNTGDLTPIMQEDGSILFVDNEAQGIYLIPVPYMYDSEGINSDAVSYTLTETEDYVWTLTVTADSSWINAADRVFPITIDPTLEIITSASSKSIITSYVKSDIPNASPYDNTTYVDVGTTSSSVHRKGLIYIKDLPAVPDGAIVTGAQLAMYNVHGPLNDQYLNLYSSTSTAANSNPEYYLNHATWNGIASVPYGGSTSSTGRKILDYAKVSANETGWCSWNITSLVQSWYDGSGPSRLLVLEGAVTTGEPYVYFRGYKSSYSSRPTLVVHYQNMVGLEGCYNYQSQNLGLAGSGSVNNYTLGLTIAEALSSSASVSLPFSFGLYYNSDRAENKCTKDDGYITRSYSGHAGQGWKLSVQQTVYSLRIDEGDGNNVFYLVYLDEDGTEHYFKYDDAKSAYIDEDGLNLSITISTSSNKTIYTMTDDNKNTWEFFNGYLTTYTDYHGNNLYYVYDDATYTDENENWKPSVNHETHKVTEVVRKNNGGTMESLLSLEYDDNNGCLSSITERGNRTTYFSYESRTVGGTTLNYLKEIVFLGSRKAKYQYANYTANSVTKHLLTRAYDSEANYGIQYSYLWRLNSFRIKNIYEYHLQNNQEETRNKMHMYKSDAHHTAARFYGSDMQSTPDGMPSQCTADDIVTVYNFDDWGRMTSTYSKDGNGKVVGAATAAYTKKEGTKADNNRMTHASQTGASSRNLLDNGSIESSVDVWTYWEYNASYANGIRAEIGDNGQLENGITPNHGRFALKTWVSGASAGSTAQAVFYRPITLQKNKTYTLSAYVNTNKITDFRYKNVGVFFSLPAVSGPLSLEAYDSIDYKTTAMASGWERLSVTYTAESTAVYWVGVCQNGPAGVVYYDDIQLEQSDVASSVNLLSCGSFERSDFYSYWNRSDSSNVKLATDDDNVIDGTRSLMIQGSSSVVRKASQSVSIKKSAKATFILSGWAKAESAPNAQNDDLTSWKPFFGLIASIVYENSTEPGEQHRIPFNSNTTTWQYTSGVVVPKHPERTIARIDVFVSYHNNINTAYFDNICLSQEPVQTYTYDSETGKLLSSNQTENDESTYQYDNDHRLTQYQTLGGVTFQKTYVGDKRDPKTIVSDGLTTTYYYDYDDTDTSASAGNVTRSRVTGSGTNKYLESSATYDFNSNYQLSTTSSAQITTSKTYDTNTDRVLTSTIPLGNGNSVSSATIYNTYYITGRVKSIYQGGVANITNDYDQYGHLDKLKRKTFRNGATIWQAYDYNYDDWGQPLGFSVKKSTQENGGNLSAGTTIITKEYYPNGNLRKNTFSNGDRINYYYDNLDRKEREEYYNSNNTKVAEYRYVYDAQGNLAKQYAVNISNGSHSEEYRFEYDSLGRQIRSRELTSSGSTIQLTEHLYDTANRLSDQRWMVAGREFYEHYTYNNPGDSNTPRNDGSLASMRAATGDNVVFTYDNLKRPTRIDTNTTANATRFYTEISYCDISSSNQTTNQISSYSVQTGANSIINCNNYIYDAAGNIKQIKQRLSNNTERVLLEYKYDSLNQLTEETRYNYSGNSITPLSTYTTTYSYDTAGNLQSSLDGVNSIECTYGDSNWPDLLTKVTVNNRSKDITYQDGGAGNPDNWYNGEEYIDLTWTQGRQLTGLKKDNTNISYTYDMEGIRSGKQAGNISHSYITQDGKVVRDSFSGKELFFIYDNSDKPYAMMYSDAGSTPVTFYYILNAQGDVIGLMDESANQIVSYTYDAWGNILTSHSSSYVYNDLDQINPLRYRGYYYDTETGWYYLQSRYYDPAVKRFINADDQIDKDANFIGCNLFCYCANNPVENSDPNGKWIIKRAIKWLAKRVIRPIIKKARKRLSKINATYSNGLSISGSVGAFSVTFQGGISIDAEGNVAFQGSFLGGLTTSETPSASFSIYNTVTNAPSVDNLNGPSYQLGGSVCVPTGSVPIYAGGDYVMIPKDNSAAHCYSGISMNIGIGTPATPEFHAEWGETATAENLSFNIFDAAENIYRRIMEW